MAAIPTPPEDAQTEAAEMAPPRSSATTELVKEMRYLLRARNHLIWISSQEERRVEIVIAAAATAEKYKVRFWDCADGARDVEGKEVEIGGAGKPKNVPAAVFDKIRQKDERAVWVLRDLHDWTQDRMVTRGLKSLTRDLQDLRDKSKLAVIVVLTASEEIPLNLRNSAVKWDWPLPKREEAAEILDEVVLAGKQREQISIEEWGELPRARKALYKRVPAATGGEVMERVETDEEVRLRRLGAADAEELVIRTAAVVDAAVGLTADDMQAAMARSIVRLRKVDAGVIASEKKRMVSQVPGLTWWEPDVRGLGAIGGLGLLKEELLDLRTALAPEAKEFGLTAPRGILLVGPPGTGKSLTAKAAATAFEVPLLKLDLAATKGGTVGSSEGNIRRALRTVEAVARCVLWVDEIDQALAGSTSEYTGDSGVSKDQLGVLLTFLQEHPGFIFLIATTNNPHRLPAELTRAGRFNATFFCDLPNAREREEILAVSLRALPVPRDPGMFDLGAVARATAEFSGAELSELANVALRKAFRARREVATADLHQAAEETVPVSRSAKERLQELRTWAKDRARPASEPEAAPAHPMRGHGRPLFMDPAELEIEAEEEGEIQ